MRKYSATCIGTDAVAEVGEHGAAYIWNFRRKPVQMRPILAKAVALAFVGGCLMVAASAMASEAENALDRAIDLFEQGYYSEAQEILLKIDRDSLDEELRDLRDEYVDRARMAISMVERADLDLENAEEARANERFAEAKKLLEAVLANEYSTKSQRDSAKKLITGITEEKVGEAKAQEPKPSEGGKSDAKQPAIAPAKITGEQEPSEAVQFDTERARTLTREGHEALQSGRNSEAIRLFEEALRFVPGHPEAMAGLKQARSHNEVEMGSRSLIERIKQKNEIKWNRAKQKCLDLQAEVQEAVLSGRFDLAKQLLLAARQVAEGARQYAEPLAKYEGLVAELDALGVHVENESARADRERVAEQRAEVQRKEAERRRQTAETRQRQVDALMEQAIQLRKDRDFKEAVKVLKQLLVIDPKNERARWMRDDLWDTHMLTKQKSISDEINKQQQAILVDAEESKIPWHELLRYPENWLEITSSPDRVASGRERLSAEDRQLHAVLDKTIPVDIEDEAFEEVIDNIASQQGVNITVIWNDLEAVGIDRDLPVTLRFASEVKFKKALREILDQIGGSEVELGFLVSDGVIKIASQQLLDQDVYIDVYPIEDLLLSVPDFEGPQVQLSGGGTGGGGGGGGGTQGGTLPNFQEQEPFQDEGQDDNEGDQDREQRIEDLLTLIRNTIEPESWRENGGIVAAIAEMGGQLVVTQTASAHEEVQDLLRKLREQRAIQIAIEARFITITSNYLEELGLDLNVVLNQGNAGYDRVGTTREGTALLLPRSMSRLGFMPGVPGVGTALQTGTQSTPVPNQPFNNVAMVPGSGNGLVQASNATPIPIISNLLNLVQPTETVVANSFGGATPAMQMFGTFLDGIQVDFLLRATQADRRSSVMNAPRLVLFNGQRSYIGVLNKAAYVAQVVPVVDENAVAQLPVVRQLITGTVLDVQAVVDADKRYVTMNLRPGVSQPVGPMTVVPYTGGASGAATAADAFIQLPNVQRQSIKTTVSVPDGGTLLIGGMKVTQEIETEAGVPVLSKIPVLKRLYSARNIVKDEQVLLILVKPTIIIQREQEEEAFPTFGQRF